MNRVVFLSVLLLMTFSAVAGEAAPADTSVIPKANVGMVTGVEKKREKKMSVAKATAVKKVLAEKSAAAKTSSTKTAPSKLSATKSPDTKPSSEKTSAKSPSTPVNNSNPTSSNTSKTKTSKNPHTPSVIGIELYQPLTFKYAILLDVPVEKVTDEKLLEVLDHWYGTRYRFGGESKKGVDCSAFTQAFMLSYLDYKLPRVAAEQFAACKKIKKKKLRQGDLVFFKTHGPKGGITHVGVYLFNDRFVHSASSTGVRISNLTDDYYMEKFAGAGRIR